MSENKRIYVNRFYSNYFIRRAKKYGRWKKKSDIVLNRNAEMCNENGFPDYNQTIENSEGALYRHDLIASIN